MVDVKINNAGLKLVKEFEGCRLTAYKCPAGVWTIGYGHTGKVDGKAICKGMIITEAKATELLKADMEKYEKTVAGCSALTFTPNENQFSALVSFAFNCGAANLYQLVRGRSAATVADKMLLYKRASGKVLAGLLRRRQAERKLFLTAVESKKTVNELATEVIAGKWGTGAERKARLTAAGYDYAAVQKAVNAMLKK